MSQFTTPLDLRAHGVREWEVLTEFTYYRTNDESKTITVPKGFRSDLATIPRFLWSLFPPHDKYAKAAIIHDYLYEMGIGTKDEADEIFKEALTVLGIPKWKIFIFYHGVRLIGKGNFTKEDDFLKHQKQKESKGFSFNPISFIKGLMKK